jgi:membrane associated rhomboid family serine protease
VSGLDPTGVIIFDAPHRAPVAERSLVLSARGIDHAMIQVGPRWQLQVAPDALEQARDELADYERENWPRPTPVAVPEIETGIVGVLAYAAVLIGFAALDDLTLWGIDWRAAGRLHAGSVLDGEWWRTVTALTLHLDLAHIAANLAFGIFFGLFAGRYLGSGVAWLSILVAGALGNGLNAFLQAADHRAVGASTAVFAALGLLSAFVWRRGYLRHLSWPRRLAPVIAGLALLAYTGTGDENTDVVAHLTGFICGFALGLVYGVGAGRMNLGRPMQWLAAVTGVVLLGLSWGLAIQAWLAVSQG